MNRPPSARYEQMKHVAADVIEDYALSYPLDTLKLADRLGMVVVVEPEDCFDDVAWLCGTRDGYTFAAESAHGTKFHTMINRDRPRCRQRFTVMHEVGHVLLDHLIARPLSVQRFPEIEANFMASYLLAPDALVLTWVPTLNVSEIAARFDVSGEAADEIYRRVFRTKNRGGAHRPHDERIRGAATRHTSWSMLGTADLNWMSA